MMLRRTRLFLREPQTSHPPRCTFEKPKSMFLSVAKTNRAQGLAPPSFHDSVVSTLVHQLVCGDASGGCPLQCFCYSSIMSPTVGCCLCTAFSLTAKGFVKQGLSVEESELLRKPWPAWKFALHVFSWSSRCFFSSCHTALTRQRGVGVFFFQREGSVLLTKMFLEKFYTYSFSCVSASVFHDLSNVACRTAWSLKRCSSGLCVAVLEARLWLLLWSPFHFQPHGKTSGCSSVTDLRAVCRHASSLLKTVFQ